MWLCYHIGTLWHRRSLAESPPWPQRQRRRAHFMRWAPVHRSVTQASNRNVMEELGRCEGTGIRLCKGEGGHSAAAPLCGSHPPIPMPLHHCTARTPRTPQRDSRQGVRACLRDMKVHSTGCPQLGRPLWRTSPWRPLQLAVPAFVLGLKDKGGLGLPLQFVSARSPPCNSHFNHRPTDMAKP